MTVYSASVLRTVALHAQGLAKKPASTPADRDAIHQIIDRIGCVQLDTLHMVRRSHYLVLWSRLGSYNPEDLDALTSSADRRLFEGWQHAASIIPLSEYRFQLPAQRNLREHPAGWYDRWLNDSVNREFVPLVLERLRREGPLKVSNFESDGHRGGTWWNWRPAKVALEYLYAYGEVMIAGREKFQRLYDLTSRVLPPWVDLTEPSVEERDRHWVELGAKALGVCSPRHAGDYTWMKVFRSKPILEELIKDGILTTISGKTRNGVTGQFVIHRENLPVLEQAADGALTAERTTFLSPFDNLWWASRRDEQLWGFHQSLEAYLPAEKRIYGYFCLPILYRDALVGRFDPKLERKTGTLRLKSLYLEPGIKPDEAMVRSIVTALQDFMAFHAATQLVIEQSKPVSFAKKINQFI
jgi:uncharacterized protein